MDPAVWTMKIVINRVIFYVNIGVVEAPKKKAVKKAPRTGACLLRRLYIVNAVLEALGRQALLV